MSIGFISTTFDLGDWDLSTVRFGVIRAVDIWRLDLERKKAFKEDWKQLLEKITSVPWDHDINRLRDAMASVLRKYRVTWIDPRSETQFPWKHPEYKSDWDNRSSGSALERVERMRSRQMGSSDSGSPAELLAYLDTFVFVAHHVGLF